MTDEEYERWLAGFTLIGDEAYAPDEKVPRWEWNPLTDEERRTYNRDRSRRLRANPEFRQRERERANARARAKRAAARALRDRQVVTKPN